MPIEVLKIEPEEMIFAMQLVSNVASGATPVDPAPEFGLEDEDGSIKTYKVNDNHPYVRLCLAVIRHYKKAGWAEEKTNSLLERIYHTCKLSADVRFRRELIKGEKYSKLSNRFISAMATVGFKDGKPDVEELLNMLRPSWWRFFG
jgi:hypothetical protein